MSFASPQAFGAIARIVHGTGTISTLPEEAKRLGATRILLVSDTGLERAGVLGPVQALLDEFDVEVFTDVEPDPSLETVARCAEVARTCHADLVIGLGGGSVIDVAKCAAAFVNNPGDVRDYLGIDQLKNPAVSKIMIPTTAGTGSEVTNVAVLSLKAEKTKKGIVSRHLLADCAILDPELTLGLPAAITAATGMDALTHAIEAYLSRFAQPLTDYFALQAITKLSSHLRTAVHHGANIHARQEVMTASLFGGLAFGSAATGMVHGLAMPLGGLFNIPHGIANAVLLPHVMRWNMPAAVARFADIAKAMGQPVDGRSPREAALLAITTVEELSADVGIPRWLDDLGIPRSAIDALVDDGLTNMRQILPNPRDVTREGLMDIMNKAFRP